MIARHVRPRSRFAALLASLMLVASLGVVTVQAVHDDDRFELDKNVSNNTNITKLGDLAANITAGAGSLNICQTGTAPATPFIIQLEAERMTVTANAAGSFGGNCVGNKRTYSVTRAADGTTATAHAKGGVDGIVSLYVSGVSKPGTDWNQVYASITADANDTGDDDKCTALGLVECSFVADGIGPTTFIGGGSKDHLPISGWQESSGASPDKAEILNAYAAKALDTDSDDELLYFGMDRYAVDGSTDIGFWFFKGPVATDGEGGFTGEHQVGDVLALGTFTQGGATSNIRVFKWVGTGGNESGTIQGPDGTFGDCVPGEADDDGCATVNDTTVPVPWTYTFKGSAKSGWVPAGGGFEGGINLSELGLEGCFSSFLAETRSSPEITAILKDFALGTFEACDTELTTTPKNGTGGGLTADSDNDNLSEISIGTGSVGVTDSAVLDVKGTTNFTGTLNFYLCGPITSGACSDSGVEIGAAAGVNPVTADGTYSSAVATVTSAGRYCWYAAFDSGTEGVPDASDGTTESAGPPKSTGECFEVLPVTPGLDTQAVASPVNFGQAVQDNATLSGTATRPGTNGPNATYPSINATNGAAAGGKITFTLLKNDCSTLATGTGTNPQDFTPISGNATYGPVSFTPDAPGTYHWKAAYVPATGDVNNIGSTHNAACTDSDETVVVNQVPTSITTRQFVYPQDKATITATGGGNLAGSVTFKLYDSLANCTANGSTGLLLTDGPHAISGASPRSATTNNTTVAVTADALVYWRVTYTSTNQAQLGSSSACVESTDVDFTGDDSGISVP